MRFSTIPIFALAVLTVATLSASGGHPEVDFDNPQITPVSVLHELKANSDEQPVETPGTATVSGTIVVKTEYKSETGEWIVIEPRIGDDNTVRQKFPPGTEMRTTLSCRSQSPNPNPNFWSVESVYFNKPEKAGHAPSAHLPAPPLRTPGGAELPNPIKSGILAVNQDFVFSWMAPEFATEISRSSNFQHACTGGSVLFADIKVPGLGEMPAGSFRKGYELTGTTNEHPSPANHHVTPEFKTTLEEMALAWRIECPKSDTLKYNDMSLPWGGLFDIKGNWKPKHEGHRVGENADVSKRWVRKGNRKKLINLMCGEFADVFSEGDVPGEQPHYHLRARGSKNKFEELNPKITICCGLVTPQACLDYDGPPGAPDETDCPDPAPAGHGRR